MNRYLLAFVLAVLPVVASAQSQTPSSPFLSVKGHAERNVQPDRFAIDLRVVAVDMKPAAARTRVEQLMSGVLAGFKAHHALPESIDASALRMVAKTDYRGQQESFLGTEVTRTAHAVFTRIEDLRQFIDGVEANKELQITNTTVTRSDIESIRQDVTRDAIKDSIRSAKAMADAYGVRLGTLYTVTDTPPARGDEIFGYNGMVGANAAKAPAIDMEVGSITVEQNVFALYLIDPTK